MRSINAGRVGARVAGQANRGVRRAREGVGRQVPVVVILLPEVR